MGHIGYKRCLRLVRHLCQIYKFFHQTVLFNDVRDIYDRQYIALEHILFFQFCLLNLIVTAKPVQISVASLDLLPDLLIALCDLRITDHGNQRLCHRIQEKEVSSRVRYDKSLV